MHCSSFEAETSSKIDGDLLVAIAAYVTEGRTPVKKGCSSSRGFAEGPHCGLASANYQHTCDPSDDLCQKYEKIRKQVNRLWEKGVPICVEVLLTPGCSCPFDNSLDTTLENPETTDDLLLEQWYFYTAPLRPNESVTFKLPQLLNAIRSQLHFSQISAWLSSHEPSNNGFRLTNKNLRYSLSIPGETFETSKFGQLPSTHNFPKTNLGNGLSLSVSLLSLPRMNTIPLISCEKCQKPTQPVKNSHELLDDRMLTSCTIKGKHRCDELDEFDSNLKKRVNFIKPKRMCNNETASGSCSTSGSSQDVSREGLIRKASENLEKFKTEKRNIGEGEELNVKAPKLDFELSRDEIKEVMSVLNPKGEGPNLRGCRSHQHRGRGWNSDAKCVQSNEGDAKCDKMSENGDIFNHRSKLVNIYVDQCDSLKSSSVDCFHKKMQDISNLQKIVAKQNQFKGKVRQKINFDEGELPPNNKKCVQDDKKVDVKCCNGKGTGVPSVVEQAKFRKSFDNAASMVFHSRTGLPLTSSPAPIRRGKASFDFDSSINSVSAIKSALFSGSFSTDEDSESDGSIVSPCSPDTLTHVSKEPPPLKYHRKGHSGNLLGTFEESVLNGRLEPVSTVHGFRAELGASGSFVPKHLYCPVTVFFYNLGDSDKVSSPYLGHINLGKKGYNVPKAGTVQVTLFNPLGTVVKMFVIVYDLSDMPPNSQTFIRQRTLYMPTDSKDENVEWGPKWLRYLIHLRFMSSKSGRIYLHSDIRMIIFRQSDLDTATAHGRDMSYELRSFTHMPSNPKYSSKKTP